MAWIAPAIGGASAIAGMFSNRGGTPNYAQLIAQLRAAQPTGYLTDADRAFAAAEQNRAAGAVARSGEQARYQIGNRLAASGLTGSAAAGRDYGREQQQEASGRENAADEANNTLYNLRHAREGQEWQNERDIFGAQLGIAQNEQRRNDLQQSTFYNSLNQFLPTIMSHFGGGTGGVSNGNTETQGEREGVYN